MKMHVTRMTIRATCMMIGASSYGIVGEKHMKMYYKLSYNYITLDCYLFC